jgi:endonuclease/exonuclease/phosphatase family metal-dependent hydrolase
MPSRVARSRRLRVATYNVLHGGEGRESLIGGVLARLDADVVALQEASDLGLVDRLADRLGMSVAVGEPSDPASTFNVVVLSRVPVHRTHNHRHAGMLRSHLEVEVRPASRALPALGVHVVHLAARFGERGHGEARRMRELGSALADIAAAPDRVPHLLLGDLNAIAPGDTVEATTFLARMTELRRAGLLVPGDDGFDAPIPRPAVDDPAHDARWRELGINPRLDVGISRLPSLLGVVTARVPRHPVIDRALGLRIRRDCLAHLGALGYVDCYRRLHDDSGYTCATWALVSRIDYLLADPALAARLLDCEVVGGTRHTDPETTDASDHLPVFADFRL